MQKSIKTIVANDVLFEDLKSLNVVVQKQKHDERQHKTLVANLSWEENVSNSNYCNAYLLNIWKLIYAKTFS